MHVDEADREVEVVRELEPWRDVPVVVEPRDEDLVAGPQRTGRRAAEREVQRGHVRAEDRLVRRASEKLGGREPCLCDDGVRSAARLERAAGIRVRLSVVARDGFDHLVGDLGATGAVEEDEVCPKRAESAADGFDVERDRAH